MLYFFFFPSYFPLQPHYSYFTQLAVETVNQLVFPWQEYPSNNKASINNPSPLHELRNIIPEHPFHPGPKCLQPQVMQRDSNLCPVQLRDIATAQRGIVFV